jgi:hypothetical protein
LVINMGQEQPINIVAFPNSPGMITLTWNHSGEDVYWFVVEQESPYTFWLPDAGKRIWSVLGLEPNHTYRYRVCAVYDFNRVCSDESGVGWVSVTTFSPEQQPVAPPPPPPPTECGPQLPRYVSSFESLNFPGHLMRHRNSLGGLTPVGSALDRADATFITRPFGLTGTPDAVSFESLNFPGHFLRHNFSRIKLHANDGSELFRQDATFKLRPNGSRGVFSQVRYESLNFPGYFIRHSNFELWLGQEDGSEFFRLDSTWRRLHAPLGNTLPGATSFESFNFPCHFIRHRNSLGELTGVASDLDRADATFVVRPALNGSPIAVSLESVNFPGHFLRHNFFRIKLHANDGSELFRQDASFIYNDGAAWEGNGGVSFESVNLPGHFIRHSNFELWLAQSDGSTLFGQDASWQAVPARQA